MAVVESSYSIQVPSRTASGSNDSVDVYELHCKLTYGTQVAEEGRLQRSAQSIPPLPSNAERPEEQITMVWSHGLTFSIEFDVASELFCWKFPSVLPRCRLLRYDARGHGRSTRGESAAFTPCARCASCYIWDELLVVCWCGPVAERLF